MARFHFELAREKDDAQLRALLQASPMEGEVSLLFTREPNYFQAACTEGVWNQTIVVRDQAAGKIVGLASRSVREVFVNGKLSRVGYLGSLRISRACRNRLILGRGYHFLKQLHEDKRARIYLTTIMADNTRVKEVLVSGRAGLPHYHDIGQLNTYVIPLAHKKLPPTGIKITKGSPDMLDQVEAYLGREGPRKQFFPFFDKENFKTSGPLLRDLKIENFLIAVENNRILGVCACWDQSRFKQIVVHQYQGRMKFIRPLYNFWAKQKGYPVWPRAGDSFRYFYVSWLAVTEDRQEVSTALLREAAGEFLNKGYDFMMIGLHENDPLNKSVAVFPNLKIGSRVYVACWPDGDRDFQGLDSRIPYIELATL